GYDHLIEHLVLQWRVLNEHGYQATSLLVNFCRGLGRIAIAAQRLAPEHDALREGLEDFRVTTVWTQFCALLSLGQLTDNANKFASLAVELHRRLDNAISQIAEGHSENKRARKTSINSFKTVATLLALLAAIVFLPDYVSSSGVNAALEENLRAVVFVLIGA